MTSVSFETIKNILGYDVTFIKITMKDEEWMNAYV